LVSNTVNGGIQQGEQLAKQQIDQFVAPGLDQVLQNPSIKGLLNQFVEDT